MGQGCLGHSVYHLSLTPLMSMKRLQLDLLQGFVSVAILGSFTEAAKALGRTQSAISLQIKKLEESTGSVLFKRQRTRLQLTAEGKILIGYAQRILDLRDDALRRLQERTCSEVIRVGVTEHFVAREVSSVLQAGARLLPSRHFDIRIARSGTLLRALRSGALDYVVAKRQRAGHGGSLVRKEPLFWVAAEGFHVGRRAVPMLFLKPPCHLREHAIEALERSGRRWYVAHSSETFSGLRAAVQAGIGVAVIDGSLVPEGTRVLASGEGFPPLESSEFALFSGVTEDSMVRDLIIRQFMQRDSACEVKERPVDLVAA